MGKVPEWAMPMIVCSLVGTVALLIAIIETGHLVGLLGPSPFDLSLTLALASFFAVLAVAAFLLTWRSWNRLKARWATQGVRLCPNCGRLVSVGLASCSACGHSFS